MDPKEMADRFARQASNLRGLLNEAASKGYSPTEVRHFILNHLGGFSNSYVKELEAMDVYG